MEGVSIPGVELLKVGRWNNREYTLRDLDDMVASFRALAGIYRPYGKLGHNDDQALLASDGLPAAGWLSNLYRVGSKLIGDFTDVPKKVAELIKARAYRTRSCEIWFNTKIEDQVYPAVLKAVAWLGAEVPAVAGLDDIVALYTDQEARQVTVVTLSAADEAQLAASDESFDRIRLAVAEALQTAYPYQLDPYARTEGYETDTPPDDVEGPSPSIRDLYLDRVIVADQDGDALWEVPFTMADNGDVTLGTPRLVKVQYVPVPNGEGSEEADEAQMTKSTGGGQMLTVVLDGKKIAEHLYEAGARGIITDTANLADHDPNVGGGVDRDKIPAADFAGKNRSFPIVTPGDVADAAASIGRAGADNYSPDELKQRIIAIAKRKGAAFVAKLPKAWRDEMDGSSKMSRSDGQRGVETMEDREIRALLGLAEDADIKTELVRLTATRVDLADFEAVRQEVTQLKAENADLKRVDLEREADALVEQALSEGKLAPKQTEWAKTLCLSDRALFESFVANAPKVLSYDERGQNPDPGEPEDPTSGVTEAAQSIARGMGVDPARLADQRPLAEKLAERQAALATSH